MVGLFDSLPDNKKGMSATVVKNGQWMFIDLNGKEFADYTSLAKYYGFYHDQDPYQRPYMPDAHPHSWPERTPEPRKEVPGYKFTGVFTENGKRGYKVNDKVLIKPIYESIKQLSEIDNYLFFKVQQNGLYGLCDYQGKLIVPIVYEHIEYINTRTAESFFRVKQNGKWGVLSRGGKLTVPIEFDEITDHRTGSVSVLLTKKGGMQGAVSTSGKTIIEPKYQAVKVNRKGATSFGFVVWENDKCGYINEEGVLKVPIEYKAITHYTSYISYSTENGMGALDTNGVKILDPIYSEISRPSGANCFIVSIKVDGIKKSGVFDLKGNQIVAPEFELSKPFGNEYEVKVQTLYYFSKDKQYNETKLFNIKTLEWIFPYACKIGSRGGTYVVIMVNDPEKPGEYLSGVVDENGKLIIPTIYKNLRYIESQRVAMASLNGKYGLVGENNTVVLPFKYDDLELVYNIGKASEKKLKNYFIYSENEHQGLIDINGKIIIPAIYDQIKGALSGIICKTIDKSNVISPTGKIYISISHDLKALEASGLFECRDTAAGVDCYGHIGKIPNAPIIRKSWEDDPFPPEPIGLTIPVPEADPNEVVVAVDEVAEFVGGKSALIQFIANNTIYPELAIELGINGKCYISFIVEKDGSLTDIKVQKKLTDCPPCDEECIRVVKKMPKWKPAKVGGEPVRSKFVLPIKFAAQ